MFGTGTATNSLNNQETSPTDLQLSKEAIDEKYEQLFAELEQNLDSYFSKHYAYWNKDVLEYPEKLNF